ncbi:cation-translocating P-type ATPase [uncultured Chitinophaga sp.]|uniref:cation-translocating P-type ATPase n=1 Tax=uncultured Chitinophaga sp. TaxID=339340 RepID=UPI0025E94B49|nr:cation-translocating P-type ATPase [uncultured Chitinophaga sp.]
MPDKVTQINDIKGLRQTEAVQLQARLGKNTFSHGNSHQLLHVLLDIIREPMFILLAVACSLYFLLGQASEGYMMVGAIMIVTAISLYEDIRSTRALDALKRYTQQKVKVVRDGREQEMPADDLVPGDIMMLKEGDIIPADALVLQQNDFSVDESLITGESFPVDKKEEGDESKIFQGTTVNTGQCYARVIAIGNHTILGKLGKSVSGYDSSRTILQQQVGLYVKRLAIFGGIAFLLIWLANYLHSGVMTESLLFALTLAMAAIPEEIPVAFSSFMALGAYQMSRLGIITRRPQVIENLGAVSTICLDKTGTITENRMQVKEVYVFLENKLFSAGDGPLAADVLGYGRLASETTPFDAMEKAILEAYQTRVKGFLYENLTQVYEYPLEGKPPMMTHIYGEGSQRIAAAKGAAERILKVCRLDDDTVSTISAQVKAEAARGYRVIGVASATCPGQELPAVQDDFDWQLQGFICLYDPPRPNVSNVITQFYDAGIAVKLLTGDYPETAMNIAGQVGIIGYEHYLTGNDVMAMSPEDLLTAVKQTTVFARMFPEAKEKVVRILLTNGEVVAMTGDGVNDAPALKAADIGVAMGQKGAETARNVADLVITDDDMAKLVEAVKQGRRIFVNLKKSIRYIISIHIPIIITAALPILLGWKYPNIFTPVHVIFLELIMGPTCSIFFEREPVEADVMKMLPRKRNSSLFNRGELLVSILQGGVIAIGVLALYYMGMVQGSPLEKVRAMVFTTLLIANIFLTFNNRSFTESLVVTTRYKNNLAIWVLLSSIVFVTLILLVPAIRGIFGLSPLTLPEFSICTATAFVSVMWFEVYKIINKSKIA